MNDQRIFHFLLVFFAFEHHIPCLECKSFPLLLTPTITNPFIKLHSHTNSQHNTLSPTQHNTLSPGTSIITTMVPKPFNLRKPDPSTTQEGSRKHLHSEIREMTSALTHHLNDLHHIGGKSTSVHHDENEDDQGVRIITLAGNNTGATMQGELDDTSDTNDDKEFTTYTNSNFQAINNSIMFGGSFNCKDPGVHIETCIDYDEPHENRKVKHGNKGKKKVAGTSRSDKHSDGSSDENSE